MRSFAHQKQTSISASKNSNPSSSTRGRLIVRLQKSTSTANIFPTHPTARQPPSTCLQSNPPPVASREILDFCFTTKVYQGDSGRNTHEPRLSHGRMSSAVKQDLAVSGSTATGIDTASRGVIEDANHTADRSNHTNDDDDVPQDMVSSTLSNSSVTSPPYWMNASTHQRNISNISAESLPAGAITLQDNDTSEHDDRNNACWAKSVEIVDYTIVNGGATSIGAFVVWNVRVETLTVCIWMVNAGLS